MESQTPDGATLYLLLSSGCNMACTYCLAGTATYETGKPSKMSLPVARAAIDRSFLRLSPRGHLSIVFFGGEPLLNWPLARELVDASSTWSEKYGGRTWDFHLTTNLSLLPVDLAETCLEHRVGVLVDVDGPPDLHDQTRMLRGGRPSHRLIAKNIASLAAAGVEVQLRATVTSVNVERMSDVARHHRELGGSSSALAPVNPIDSDGNQLPDTLLPDPTTYEMGLRDSFHSSGWTPDRLFPFSQYLDRLDAEQPSLHACGAPLGNTPAVDSLGDIYPCIYWVGLPDLRAGSVLEPEGEGLNASTLRTALNVDTRRDCRGCSWRYLCGGACPATDVLLRHHQPRSELAQHYSHEIYCRTAKVVLEELLWRRVRDYGYGGIGETR